MVTTVFNSAKEYALNGGIDWTNDTIKVALVNNSSQSQSFMGNPDPDPPEDRLTVSDVFGVTAEDPAPANEFDGTNYSRETVSTSTGIDSQNNLAFGGGDTVTWNSLDGDTIAGVLVYKQMGDSADDTSDRVVCLLDSADLPKTANAGDMILQFNQNGILTIG